MIAAGSIRSFNPIIYESVSVARSRNPPRISRKQQFRASCGRGNILAKPCSVPFIFRNSSKQKLTNGGVRRALSRTSVTLFRPLQKYGQATSLERGPSASSIDPIRFQNICQYEIQIHLFIFYDCYKTAVRDPFVSIPLHLLNSPLFVLNLSKHQSLPSIDPIRFQKRLQLAFAQIYTPSD